MNGSRFSSFLLIISKHWNTLQLNGFIPRKVWDYYSVAAIKLNETVLILAKEPLSVKEEKCVLRTRHFSPVISPQRSAVNRPGGVCCEFYVFLCHSICFWRKLREEKKNQCTRRLSPRTAAVALSLLSFALAVYRLGNARGNKWCSSRLRH